MVTRPYHHEHGYRKLLDLERTYLVDNARVKSLTLYSQPAINSLRTKQYQELRNRVFRKYSVGNILPKRDIYLKRGNSGEKRLLENEQEIEALLAARGYEIVEPSSLSVDEIVRKTLGARVIVSVEGSHLSHVIFTIADDGAFVILQPPDRFSAVYKEFADCVGIKFAFVVGSKTNNGFEIDNGELNRIVDMLN